MPFKKGTSGNPIGRPKGSLSTTTKLIREHISQANSTCLYESHHNSHQNLLSYRIDIYLFC